MIERWFFRRGLSCELWRRRQDQGPSLFHKIRLRDPISLQRYYKNLAVWNGLNYPNVVIVHSAGSDIARLCVVSSWMPGGDLLQFLREHPRANRAAITRGRVGHTSECTPFNLKMIWLSAGFPISISTGSFTET